VEVGQFKKKRMSCGDDRWQAGNDQATVNLCSACRETFSSDAVGSPKWNSACFGHVWRELNSYTGQDLNFLVSTLPWSIRYWWFHKHAEISSSAYAKMMPRKTTQDCVQPVFQDVTPVRDKMRDRLGEKITARDLVYFLPKHFLPTIECPMGCLLFPEEKADFIGLQHLYAGKLKKNYTRFRAKKITFRGARGNWPSASTFMKKPTLPGLYVSKEGGNGEKCRFYWNFR
jgi:hypothetical protein